MWWFVAVFAAPTVLEADVQRIVEASNPGHTTLAMDVRTVANEVVLSQGTDRLMVPASVMKVLTTAAAVDVLGLDHTVQTRVVMDGAVHEGVLSGDVRIIGGGDPTLGVADDEVLLRSWAATLRDRGVHTVSGDVIADGRVFDDQPLGLGWTWDDALWSYSAAVTGVQLGGNTAVVEISAQQSAVVVSAGRWDVCLPVQVDARVDASAQRGDLTVSRGLSQAALQVTGAMAPGDRRVLTVTLPDPVQCVADRMAQTMAREGISVEGSARVARRTEARHPGTLVAVHISPPLRALLPAILQDSDNLVAETVARWMDPSETGKSYADAATVIDGVLRRAGVTAPLRLVDGSGLSRYDQLDAESVSRVLVWTQAQPWGPEWNAALAVAGESGTLRRRMTDGRATGQVRGKTGSMFGVSNLAVLVPTADTTLSFVMMTHGLDLTRGETRDLQDAVTERLSAYTPRDQRRCGRCCQRKRAK